ncbi:polyubiquitin-B-like isoform X2 [Echeneis naucrates]|uniref:polyubiquitin-B-like isoform X2 n=1 Tax=Echeneis naucrates TaxID=173247 RepID=UPI001113A271|nr:polyubiquitin-B-like isoform X2 [Echeneis naucrates]
MEIFVSTVTESFSLTVQPQDTVGSLKLLIQQKVGAPPGQQRLVIDNGRRTELSDDSRQVQSYGLRSGSTVTLLVVQQNSDKFQIHLITDKGATHTYDVRAEETVAELKRRVEQRERVPVSQQRLVHQSQDLGEGRLVDYGVAAGSTIQLLLRLRGGGGRFD